MHKKFNILPRLSLTALGGLAILTLPQAQAQTPVAPSAIKAIFQEKCVSCHGEEKQKGDLRLDSPEAIMKGGENGVVIVAGNAGESSLCKLISLPADDPDIMPAKGDPLTPEQIAAIAQWINEGAKFEGWDDAPAPAAPAKIKANAVRAIFAGHCVGCHGPEKQKGELRLDTAEFVQKGGDDGTVIVAGNPGESVLCKLINLPVGEEGHMPAEGEPLSDADKATIAQWIQEGADYAAWDEAVAAVETINEVDVYNPVVVSALYADDILTKLAEGLAPAAPEAIKALEDAAVQVLPISQESPLLRVNFQFVGDKYSAALLDLLQPIAANVTWLNLSGTAVTDADLAKISGLANLTALHLENTGITDVGIPAIQGLQHLEYLNLYNTKVSDASAPAIKTLVKLKRIYLWQTQVTADAAKALNEALPDAVINMGIQEAAPVAAAVPAEAAPAEVAPAEAAPAEAAPAAQ